LTQILTFLLANDFILVVGDVEYMGLRKLGFAAF
jgi:hypothetical protein